MRHHPRPRRLSQDSQGACDFLLAALLQEILSCTCRGPFLACVTTRVPVTHAVSVVATAVLVTHLNSYYP